MLFKVVLLLIAALPVGAAIAVAWSLASNGAALFEAPGWQARLSTYLTRNSVDTRPDHPFPELRTRVLDGSYSHVAEAVARALESLGWRVVSADPGAGRWQAVVRTPLVGFEDDVTVVITDAGGGRTALDVRSRSRVGRGDLGANRAHALALVAKVDTELGQRRTPR